MNFINGVPELFNEVVLEVFDLCIGEVKLSLDEIVELLKCVLLCTCEVVFGFSSSLLKAVLFLLNSISESFLLVCYVVFKNLTLSVNKSLKIFGFLSKLGIEFVDKFLDSLMIVAMASIAIASIIGWFLFFNLSSSLGKENVWRSSEATSIAGSVASECISVATIATKSTVATITTVSGSLELLDLPLGVFKE